MLVRNRLKFKVAVAVVGALSLTACGQNASITKKSPLNSSSQIDKTAPQANPQGGTQPPVNPSNPANPGGPAHPGAVTGPTGANPVTPATPITPVRPPSGNPPSETPKPVTPAPAPSAVPVPAPGKPADPVKPAPAPAPVPPPPQGCGLMDVSPVNVPAIPMEASDYKASELPYLSTKLHPISILQIGQSTPGKVTVGGVPYVLDSQVLFKFPMHLPPRESISKLYKAYLQLALVKISNDGFPKTEWLCFLDQKVCSGKVYDAKLESDWQPNVNPAFWGKGQTSNLNGEFSDLFVSRFVGTKVGTVQGLNVYQNDAFTIQLEDLLAKSKYDSVLSFLYDGVKANSSMDKDIRMAVADDTRVLHAQLVIEYQQDTCKAFDLEPLSTDPAKSVIK